MRYITCNDTEGGHRRMEAIITLKNVKKSYKQTVALDGINLDIYRGEIFGLLGPSGAGKTTMIKLLTGQLRSTAGEIEVLGMKERAFQRASFRARIGVLTDNSALYERLTVYDNLKLFCKLYDAPLRRIDEVLQFINLKKEAKKRVSKLSKGMKQRVLLAKAFIHEPEILFLDEPTSALDPGNRAHIHQGLRKLNEKGTTIFLNTHDMEEATELCHRVAFLHEGKIVELNEPDELRHKYAADVFHIETVDGKWITMANEPKNAQHIASFIADRNVKTMQTDLPSLGEVFLQVTGKELMQ